MTRFSSDSKQRRSRKYKALHEDLARTALQAKREYQANLRDEMSGVPDLMRGPEPDKSARKRLRSAGFVSTGEL